MSRRNLTGRVPFEALVVNYALHMFFNEDDTITIDSTNIPAPFTVDVQGSDDGVTWVTQDSSLVYPTDFPIGPYNSHPAYRLKVNGGPADGTLSNVSDPP